MSTESNPLVGLAVWAGIALVAWFGFWGRNMSIRYQLQYELPAERVSVAKEPKDCEFLTAPLGRKNCDYEKKVSIWTYGKDAGTGRATISYDGTNWQWNDNGPESGKQVNVWWEKVDD